MTNDSEQDDRDMAAMIRAAYPDGIPETDYPALLMLIYADERVMSFRAAAAYVSEATGKDCCVVYNDVQASTRDSLYPSRTDLKRVRMKLLQHGFRETPGSFL